MKIEDLGYNSFFEESRNQLGLSDFPVARIISEHKGAYKVKDVDGEYLAKITGKQIFEAKSREDYPAVGDWVAITRLDNDHAVIQGALERSTVIKRKHGDKNRSGEKDKVQIIAANIDVAFVVESLDRDYSLNRFERYIAIAENGGVKPAIILNKVDLIPKEELDERLLQLESRLAGIDVILTSTVSDEGLDELKRYIAKGKTYCFLGSSGVGKSSLINKLLGSEAAKTGKISSYSDRGKHTTTSRQMYIIDNGGIVIDNPGIREVGMTDSGGVDTVFDEIADLSGKCKFSDCTHTREPGCAVIKAVESGELDEAQYANYMDLKNEADYYEMDDYEKREKDRQFGKFMKKAKKELKDYGNKY
ncbi:MAG: putative ribosome biogenesis GTPase RsgA [bacterium ADurb.Bin400]|nr:MAG: putative ribosome biogenesis GTPase RsgA [bacterium ADurb.Bin400]